MRKVIRVILGLSLIVLALVLALLTPYWLARWVEATGALVVSAVVVFALVAGVGLGFVTRRRWSGLAVLTAGFATWVYVVLLHPMAHVAPVVPFENTRYWKLATGSRIAYSEFDPPAGVAVRPVPIVFLHGGPGLRQGPFDQRAYGALAADGFRVFLYDQAGSGLSDTLPHVRDYTVRRAVADLEAIREMIGAPRMILIGHSFGSTLAASYMASHPDRVAKVIFHSPGRLWNTFSDSFDYSRSNAGRPPLPGFRFLAGLLLRDRNPNTAERFLSQGEAQVLFTRVFPSQFGTVVCKGDSAALPSDLAAAAKEPNLGLNPYVLQQIAPETGDSAEDPHAALRQNATPAILLYPECNYLPWDGALEYRRTFQHLRIFYFPHAGHYIQFEQAELLHRVMRAFLLDQPDAIPPDTVDADPRLGNKPT